jgi:hypothetical protein
MLARESFDSPHVWHNRSTLQQDAQKSRPARPQRVKGRGGTSRRVGRSPLQWVLANGKSPPAFPTSEKLLLDVEDLNDARTKLADFLSILPVSFPGSVNHDRRVPFQRTHRGATSWDLPTNLS